MADKKNWQLAFGERGSGGNDPVSAIMRMNIAKQQSNTIDRENEIADLSHEEKKLEKQISVEKKRKEQSGENELVGELRKIKEDSDKTKEKLEEERRGRLEDKLVNEVSKLRDLVERNKGNGQQVDVKTQMETVLKTAKDIGWSPPEGKGKLSEQIEEVKLVADKLGYGEKRGNGITGDIAIQLKKMDFDFNTKLEEMRDERSRRDAEWQLTLKRYDDEKEFKRDELAQKAHAEQEKNNMFKNMGDSIGKVIGQTLLGQGGEPTSNPGSKSFRIEAGAGEEGNFECPSCHEPIFVSPDANTVGCGSCGAVGTITRK